MKILKGSRQFAVASLTVLVVLLTSLSWALADASPPLEEWSTTFGGSYNDIGYSVQVTSDGGYIITGSMQSVWDGLEVYLVKVDSHGVEEWSTTFGGYNWDMGYSVQETSDGGYIITGETNSFGDFSLDVYLVKTNSQGVEEWTTTFGGSNVDRGYSVQVTSDGGYIITGETRSFGAGGSDVYLVKTDFQGRMEWNRTFGGSSTEAGRSVQETSDGGYIIAGETSSFGTGGIDVYLVKVDSRGEEEWSTTFGGSDDDIGRSVQVTSDGGYIITGWTTSVGAGYDVYLVKVDSRGEEEWSTTFGGSEDDYGESVQVTSDGGYIITGSTYSFGAVWFDVYLVKADSQGGEEWSMTFGGSEDDGGRSVQETSDGGYIIAGETSSFGTGGIDVYLVKVDSQGREREPEPGQNGGLAPVASFTVDPGVALVGQNLVFDASDSYDPDGSISTYSWDYGDGETGEGASTLHVYEEAGEYLVALTVVDDSGATDTVSLVLDVQVFNARIIDTSPPFEEWSMTFGGSEDDGGESVQKASDGGYIIVGYTYSLGAGLSDVYLVKTDSQGVEEWSRTFGGSSWDEGYSVRETSDGGYIIVGETRSFGSGDTDVYLVKTDSQGAEEWSNTFGGSESDGGESVQETSDGGYIITGHTYSFFTGRLRLYLIKTDSQGVEEWSTTFGSTSDAGYSIQETSDGGYIIAGYTGFSGGLYKNASLLKTTSQGGQEWSATLGGINREEGRSVQETSDGGYILTGYTSSFGAGGSDVYLVKTNSRGVEEWSTTLGDYLGEIGESVLETSDSGYIIAGSTTSFSAGLSDVYLVKTDSLGGEVWSITFGGYAEDLGYSVQETSDGGYIITGKTKSFGAGGYDVYLVKVGLQGDTSSPEPEPEPSPSPDPTPEPTQTPEPSPSPEPTPEPTPEPEQGGIPGFPTLAIVIGVFLSLFILKKIQS